MREVGDGWHGVRRWHDGVGGGATQKGRGVAVRFDLGVSGDAVAALEAVTSSAIAKLLASAYVSPWSA